MTEVFFPPLDVEAERVVLGWMMSKPRALSEVVARLGSRRSFYLESHQESYDVALRLFEAGQPVDAVTLVGAGAPREAVFASASLVPGDAEAKECLEKVLELRAMRATCPCCGAVRQES